MAIIKLTQYFSDTDKLKYIYINTNYIIYLEEITHNNYNKETNTNTPQTYTLITLTTTSFPVTIHPRRSQSKEACHPKNLHLLDLTFSLPHLQPTCFPFLLI